MEITKAIVSNEFLFNVQAGFVQGARQERKYGLNNHLPTNVAEVVCDIDEEPTYAVANESIDIVSSNAADTQEIEITGLQDDGSGVWTEISIRATLNGQTPVTVDNFVRVYRMRNKNGTPLIGEVHAFVTGSALTNGVPNDLNNARAKISLTNGVSRGGTLMAMYTVPSNHTAFIYRLFRASQKAQEVEFDYQIRPFNGVFVSIGVIPSFQVADQAELGFERAEEKSDIRVVATSDTNNAVASASFHMIVVHNDYLDKV